MYYSDMPHERKGSMSKDKKYYYRQTKEKIPLVMPWFIEPNIKKAKFRYVTSAVAFVGCKEL